MKCVYIAFALLGIVAQVHSHGMVIIPPNRSSMWRFGYDYPPNYDDDGNYCGGFGEQWEQNGGKCGVCGDDYSLPRPRPNEQGGLYGLGVIPITSHYTQGGVLKATIVLTASHLGHFEFSICKMENDDSETDECFEQYPLKLTNGLSKFILTSSDPKTYVVDVQLPKDLVCDHCVFRWHYRAANNWGDCGLGIEGMGCGPQETFRTCSDIAIKAATRKLPLFHSKWQDLIARTLRKH